MRPKPWLRGLAAIAAVAACCSLVACRREPEAKTKTPAEVRAEIAKVEGDQNMPPNVKGMVLGLLRKQLEQAEKGGK
jgi:hypothetical protein